MKVIRTLGVSNEPCNYIPTETNRVKIWKRPPFSSGSLHPMGIETAHLTHFKGSLSVFLLHASYFAPGDYYKVVLSNRLHSVESFPPTV